MYKLTVYIPADSVETVKTAMFEAGGGRYDGYDCCCFQVEGMGQFRPLAGSEPYIGQTNEIEQVREFRVELVCSPETVHDVVSAMIQSHPYEVPAYDIVRMMTLADLAPTF